MDKKQFPYNYQDVYNLFWEKVYLQCFYNLNDQETAKDLTQDIFRSLWERFDDLEITTSMEHYLARATKFRILEYIRNEAVKNKHNQILVNDIDSVSYTTEDNLNYKELYTRFTHLVGLLPCQSQKVFTLSKIEGLSNKEISEELSISVRTVEYHMTKAYIFIRKNLAEYSSLSVFFAIFALHIS